MGDISKTIVVVLLIATILVSVVGTWFVLNTIDNAIVGISASRAKTKGRVSVTLEDPANFRSSASGNVGVRVVTPS